MLVIAIIMGSLTSFALGLSPLISRTMIMDSVKAAGFVFRQMTRNAAAVVPGMEECAVAASEELFAAMVH